MADYMMLVLQELFREFSMISSILSTIIQAVNGVLFLSTLEIYNEVCYDLMNLVESNDQEDVILQKGICNGRR
uniref:Kif5c protein n=1 Tax=Triatoma infestans TaxID=30076 RepID=A0A161M6B0_TRIIF